MTEINRKLTTHAIVEYVIYIHYNDFSLNLKILCDYNEYVLDGESRKQAVYVLSFSKYASFDTKYYKCINIFKQLDDNILKVCLIWRNVPKTKECTNFKLLKFKVFYD